MRDPRILLGVLLGVLGGGLLYPTAARPPARLYSDGDGALREIVIQYVADAAPIVTRAYRDFLGALPARVTVRVVCPETADFEDLRRHVGPVSCGLEAVLVHHEMTGWARDRWLALDTGDAATLLLPCVEQGEALWPLRRGDGRIGFDLAAALPGRVAARRLGIEFDGGDFVADADTVFVTPNVVRRNGRPGLADSLARILGRRVVLLDEAPDHHAGMFMMPVGDGRVLVGDPSRARPLVDGDPNPAGADWSPEAQARFDAVAARCEAEGYRVHRIPVVPGRDGRTYLTYVNVILDEADGGRVVYLPVYRHVPALNDAAAAVWRDLGYEVRRVDCTETYVHYGSLRCLVNVLARD